MNVDEREKLIEEFQKKFPIEKLKNLTLEEYAIGGNQTDSFCYWVERKLAKIGPIGGSPGYSYAFGMFRKSNADKSYKRTGYMSDDEYVWIKRYGLTRDEAFESAKKRILTIVKYAQDGKFENLDMEQLWTPRCCMFEWKVAFLYTDVNSPKRFVPIYLRRWLIDIAKKFANEGELITEKTPRSHLYEIIMKEQKERSFWEYYDHLVKTYPKPKDAGKIGEEDLMDDDLDQHINLLKANHNIIFHGAPGTGKTYLAKQIAARMIFGDDVPEDFEQTEQFKTQCGFVQFHPSYDYTDFVEGLRPCRDDGSDNAVNGFERCDGIFKEFCKNAIKNIQDSKKSILDLTKESRSLECLNDFLTNAIDNEKEFEIKGGNKFFIEEEDKKGRILISIPKNEKVKELTISRDTLLTVLNYSGSIKSVKDIWHDVLKLKHGTQEASYIYIILSHVKKLIKTRENVANISHVSKKNFIFIIDEINRGEVSKILGELFFSIDPGYRGEKGRVKTQYQNLVEDTDVFKDGFYVPENVYIIGTMNDIDRSVESMDFAFRRRFAWKEIKAGDSKDMLDSLDSDGVPKEIIVRAKAKMDALNAAIAEHKELNESYQIGAAYFKRIKDYVGDDVSDEDYDDAFAKLWEYHLQGLLTEYLRGIEDGTSVEMFRKVYDEAGEQSGSKEAGSASGGSEAPAES